MSHTKSHETQMAFMPSDRVHHQLTDLLTPTVAQKLIETKRSLGFYSVHAHAHCIDMPDIALRRLKRNIEGYHVPVHPSVRIGTWTHPGDTGVLVQGLVIDLAADLSDWEETAKDARLLEFADERSLVMARLMLRAEHISEEAEQGTVLNEFRHTLESSPREKLKVTFIQRDPKE